MLSIADLGTLEVDDVVEAGTIFQGMTNEPLRLLVTERVHDGASLRLRFSGSYFGIKAGCWRVAIKDGKQVWVRELALERGEGGVP